ncbi:FAD-dependent oxidoreductase [Rothia halotolerans]|uniref:FAD-dependent oxidoreductase n=1 Tax=Rothia halotolerans TaxID=405770 RepID=UPI00101D3162|nr:FAD-dependent oxidoreductase [Rothia halotolerans]
MADDDAGAAGGGGASRAARGAASADASAAGAAPVREAADVVIVGAGLTGAAAAWRLAQAGRDVLVLERDVPAGRLGSSHGSARILRYGYADGFYTSLLRRAEGGWRELERASGRRLVTRTGCVDFGPERRIAPVARAFAAEGLEHEVLAPQEAAARWPGISFDSAALFQPDAGVLDAEGTVAALLDAARSLGARVLTGWEAASVRERAAGYEVLARDGRRAEAGRVVVAAGGWLPGLLRELPLADGCLERLPPLRVMQESAFHFPYREPGATPAGLPGPPAAPPGGAISGAAPSDAAASEADAPDEAAVWPTFIHMGSGLPVYGLPGGRDAGHRGQKVARFNAGRPLADASEQDLAVTQGQRRDVVDFVRERMPGLVPEPYAETTCLFTNTPNEDFVLDRWGGVVIASPCSGHGGKFAPLLGELIRDLALPEEPARGLAAVPERFQPWHGSLLEHDGGVS